MHRFLLATVCCPAFVGCHALGGLGGLDFRDPAVGGGSATTTTSTTATGSGGQGAASTTSAGGQGGGGGAPTGCAAQGLADDFDTTTIDATRWDVSNDTEVTVGADGQVIFMQPAAYLTSSAGGTVTSQQTYDARGCSIGIELAAMISASATGYVFFAIRLDGDNEAEFIVDTAGVIEFQLETGNEHDPAEQTLSFDPVAHRWLRFREQAGTLYEETSPDGLDWSTQASFSTPPWLTDVEARFGLRASATADAPGRSDFDNLVVTP